MCSPKSVTPSDGKHQSAPDQHGHYVERSTRRVRGGVELTTAREMVSKEVPAAAKVATKVATPTGTGKEHSITMGTEKTATAIPGTTGIVNTKRSANTTKKAAPAIDPKMMSKLPSRA